MVSEKRTANCHILQAQGCRHEFGDEHFRARYWQTDPNFKLISGGRGGSCIINIDGDQAVLRRYHRGGFVGRFLTDQYLWLGKSMTRPWREWKILRRALEVGLPVPEPIAACVCRRGLIYRAALIISYLDDTEMLTQRLAREALPQEHWQRLGLLIKRMHAEGICHADLTSDNVLIDSQHRFYLIDFDQARMMNQIDDWQWRPLYRFQRSIDKRNQQSRLNYGEDDWQALMDGYQS